MEKMNVVLRSMGPMLMHSDRLSDPLAEVTKNHKLLTSDRTLKKTDDGHIAIARSEYLASFYLDQENHPCLPGMNIRKSLIEGARLYKGGKSIERGVVIVSDIIPLEYDGPKDPEALWDIPDFVDARSVVVARARLIRYRPIFRKWAASVAVLYNEAVIDADNILHYWNEAGAMIGVGDFRPLFGRYTVELAK